MRQSGHVYRFVRPCSFLTVIAFLSAMAMACGRRYDVPSPEELRALEQRCEKVLEFARAERTRTGSYPRILPCHLQELLDNSPVPITWETYASGTTFRISIGDYSKYGWEDSHYADEKDWHLGQWPYKLRVSDIALGNWWRELLCGRGQVFLAFACGTVTIARRTGLETMLRTAGNGVWHRFFQGPWSGLRYYSPRLGRWISRDPIGEEGGTALYSFVCNLPLSHFDFHGLYYYEILDSDAAEEFAYIVLKKGDLAVERIAAARRVLLETDLSFARNAINSVTSGGFYVPDKELVAHVSKLTEEHPMVMIPKGVAAKFGGGAIDILSAVFWFTGEEKAKRAELIEAATELQTKKDYSSCMGVCLAGISYLSSMPNVDDIGKGLAVLTWMHESCYETCCKKY